jgi:hypothetical protein
VIIMDDEEYFDYDEIDSMDVYEKEIREEEE